MNEYPVMLGDIATVKIGGKSPKLGTASERTKPAVLITVTKQPDTSTEKLTEKLDEIVVDLREELAGGCTCLLGYIPPESFYR